eukprot:6455299-Amphidinium_carterae.1
MNARTQNIVQDYSHDQKVSNCYSMPSALQTIVSASGCYSRTQKIPPKKKHTTKTQVKQGGQNMGSSIVNW